MELEMKTGRNLGRVQPRGEGAGEGRIPQYFIYRKLGIPNMHCGPPNAIPRNPYTSARTHA